MNIALSAATLTKVIDQSSRIIWVMKRDGEVVWASSGAEEFLGLDDIARGRRTIQGGSLYRDNIQFRNFADPEDRIDKIASILIDGRYVICRKEQMPGEGDIIFSVIAAEDAHENNLILSSGSKGAEVDGGQPYDGPVQQEHGVLDELVLPSPILSSIDTVLDHDLLEQVNQTLAVMGAAIDVDRAYIFQFDWERGTMSNTHEWCREGVEPEIDNLQNLPNSTFPWWQENLLNRKAIIVPDVSRLPSAASEEKIILSMQGIQSLLVFPIERRTKLFGFLGFDSVRRKRVWTESEIQFLRMYSQLIATMFDNTLLIRQIIDNSRRNQRLFDITGLPSVVIDESGTIVETNTVWDLDFDRREDGIRMLQDYVAADHAVKFRNLFTALKQGTLETVDGELLSIETAAKTVRQMQVHGTAASDHGRPLYLFVFQDVTKLLAYQSNVDRMHIDRSQTYLRFADAFCRLYDRFDFDWPDHYLVARFCLVIAGRAGLDKRQMTGLYIAALLHDIGKIMLPKRILLKSEKLSEEERNSVRRYIVEGAEVIRLIDFPWEVSRIIREQFEHMDGSGYPNGLSGDDLLAESQILFMANMFISLTESQNYREPFPVDRALDMMAEHAGLWYDSGMFTVLRDYVKENLNRLRFLKRSLNEIDITEYVDFSR